MPWGLLCGTSSMRKVCMVPSHICHIYGIWDLKEQRWRDALKLPFGVAMPATSGGGDNFNGEEGGGLPLCNNAALKLYLLLYISLTGYCKRFYGIHLFSIFLMFCLFCIYYWDWQGQKCKLKCPKVYEINSKLYCNCNCCLNHFLRYKHHHPKTSQEYICCN